jgi:hypothetical protein
VSSGEKAQGQAMVGGPLQPGVTGSWGLRTPTISQAVGPRTAIRHIGRRLDSTFLGAARTENEGRRGTKRGEQDNCRHHAGRALIEPRPISVATGDYQIEGRMESELMWMDHRLSTERPFLGRNLEGDSDRPKGAGRRAHLVVNRRGELMACNCLYRRQKE